MNRAYLKKGLREALPKVKISPAIIVCQERNSGRAYPAPAHENLKLPPSANSARTNLTLPIIVTTISRAISRAIPPRLFTRKQPSLAVTTMSTEKEFTYSDVAEHTTKKVCGSSFHHRIPHRSLTICSPGPFRRDPRQSLQRQLLHRRASVRPSLHSVAIPPQHASTLASRPF